MNKFVISGIGLVSPIGIDIHEFYSNLLKGKKNFNFEKEAYEGHGQDCKSSRIPINYKKEIDQIIGEKSKDLSQATKYAIYATKKALEDSGINKEYLKNKRVSIIIGNNESESELFDRYINGENIDSHIYSSCNIAEEIGKYFNIKGIQYCIHNTCASSNMALEQAINDLIKSNSDIAIVGSTDAFSLKVFTGFNSLRAITKKGCKPFAKDRDGIVISEGAGIVIVENKEDCKNRSKTGYCEVIGVGSSNDASSLTKPDKDGVMLAIRKAISNSNIQESDIDYIMSHGTGTKANDSIESAAINEIFGEENTPKVCAIKGILGHTMSSAAILSTIAICMIFKNGDIPSSAYSLPLDEECKLKVITNQITDKKCNIWMNNAFGFGGNNSVSIFRRICE